MIFNLRSGFLYRQNKCNPDDSFSLLMARFMASLKVCFPKYRDVPAS